MRSVLFGLVLCLLLVAVPARAEPGPGVAAVSSQALGGAGARGDWVMSLQVGWPWSALRVRVGTGRGWEVLMEADAAVMRRFQPSIGLAASLISNAGGRVAIDGVIGWQEQVGELAQRGPSMEVRLRALAGSRRVRPWFTVGTRTTLLFDRTRYYAARNDDARTELAVTALWSPSLAGGVAVSIVPTLGLDIGIDLHFVDVERVAVVLPGVHAALHFGGGPSRRSPAVESSP